MQIGGLLGHGMAVTLIVVGLLSGALAIVRELQLMYYPAKAGDKRLFWAFVRIAFVISAILLWTDEHSKVTQLEARLRPQPIQINVPPSQVVVMPSVPSPVITSPSPQVRPAKDRARLHIFDHKLLAENKDLITVNIFIQNVGTLSAEMKIYNATVMFVMSDDQEVEQKLEAQAEQRIREKLQELQSKKQSTPAHTVVAGPPGIWFTHQPGIKLTDEQFSEFTKRKIMIYFAGLLEYSDANATHKTYYCASNNGNPSVIFQCGITQEL